jgi:hypothetical protein
VRCASIRSRTGTLRSLRRRARATPSGAAANSEARYRLSASASRLRISASIQASQGKDLASGPIASAAQKPSQARSAAFADWVLIARSARSEASCAARRSESGDAGGLARAASRSPCETLGSTRVAGRAELPQAMARKGERRISARVREGSIRLGGSVRLLD